MNNWSNQESHEEGEGPEVSNPGVLVFVNIGYFIHGIGHNNHSSNLHHEATENGVGIEVHAQSTDSGAGHQVSIHVTQVKLGLGGDVLHLEHRFHAVQIVVLGENIHIYKLNYKSEIRNQI